MTAPGVADQLISAGMRGERQLADEMKTMLLAGHETSSLSLTWALYLLATQPAAMAEVGALIDRVRG